jgi:DNA-binding NtrC family response regulator
LVESELFGHVAGAFTGASQTRAGRIQAAAGGVLFLDEVGDLSLSAQTRLLRFLEDHRITAVGDAQETAVDVRIIAASNRPLTGEGGLLRSELFYRLRGVTITTPSLAERPEDLPALVAALLTRTARRLARPLVLTDSAMQALSARQWPGNVRELKHQLEEAAIFAQGGVIDQEHLDLSADKTRSDLMSALADLARTAATHHPGDAHAWYLRQALPPLLEQVLRHTNGNYLRASELLGINRVTLKRWTDDAGM